MANPLRQRVHLTSGARDMASEAAYLSSISIINVPGPSPGGSLGGSGIGPRGYTGDSGRTVLSGPSTPPNQIGGIGDFWLDVRPDQYVLYGPKVSDTRWPLTGTRLIGPSGRDGNRIFQGEGPPPDGLDFEADDAYFDTLNLVLYLAS